MKDKIGAEICPGIGLTKGCCPLPLLWKGEPHETDEKITGSLSALLCAALLVGILPSQAASYEIKSDVDSVTTGGLTYDYWSCLYPDSSRTFRASAWTANADVEKMSPNTVGAQGVLYSETQNKPLATSTTFYNGSGDTFASSTTSSKTTSDVVYATGTVYVRNGSKYNSYSTPDTDTYGGSRAAAATQALAAETLEPDGSYPVTTAGESYGSYLLTNLVGEMPNLVAALGVNGTEGYVKAEDFLPSANTPEEAAEYRETVLEMARNGQEGWLVPMYDLEGNVVDQYQIVISEEYFRVIENERDGIAYAVNENGETYGDFAFRSRLGYLPDLVAVNATNGASGYYRVSDLEIPKTPEEVPAYLEKWQGGRMIPVYESDGVTVVGEYEIVGTPTP